MVMQVATLPMHINTQTTHNHLTTKIKMILLLLLLFLLFHGAASNPQRGRWHLLLKNTGVVGMHMAVTHLDTVILFDQTEAGPSNLTLRRNPNGGGRCHRNSRKSSCYAHSVEYDVPSNTIRSLVGLKSDPWCSSGAFLSSGTLIQTGGYREGARAVRYFQPCTGPHRNCDWLLRVRSNKLESRHRLSRRRWYASNLLLPEKDDRVMVVGGRDAFSYEFVPKRNAKETAIDLPFLHRTYDKYEGGGNLYPFLHLSPDGHVFIFANRDSILLDYKSNRVLKTYPTMPGEGGRNYPSSGSSVLLPLTHRNNFHKAEVMVCGGAASGAYSAAERNRSYIKGLTSCGRMVISGDKHRWSMERMPDPRVMSDMIVLPTGNVLIINGAERGAGGWDNGYHPGLTPFLYTTTKPHGKRFSKLAPTKVPRMYHSAAVLLPDGRVLVAGGNPHPRYMFDNVRYPTELKLQAFVPYYMDKACDHNRPQNVSVFVGNYETKTVEYGDSFTVRFWLRNKPGVLSFSAYAPPFTTHSVGMNQRMLRLKHVRMVMGRGGSVTAILQAPPSANVAPAGHYMLTVLNNRIPSKAQWVRFTHHID